MSETEVTRIIAFNYVFPMIGGGVVHGPAASSQRIADPREVYGSAFSLGDGYFLTAGHVLKQILSHEACGLGKPLDEKWQNWIIDDFEPMEEFDLGLVRTRLTDAQPLGWETRELSMLEPVRTVGYPYGLDREQRVTQIRAFRGDVVATRSWPTLRARPRIYELSFACPRGLSGAPLWIGKDRPRIAGVILGNVITEMTAYSERETAEGGTETVYEKVEALHLGLAIQASSIVGIRSSLLGCSIGDWLAKNGLIAATPS